jgi:hypothetical protein
MKRILLLLSVSLAIASGAVIHAQQGGGVGPGILWRRYTVKDEEFSVILPRLPAMATTTVARESDSKIRLERRLFTAYDGVYYRITAFENPKPKQVQNIRVISGLPYGLTEQAVSAARQIKFTPAMKDGKPVSMWMQLEYNFNP